jgi:hypothetical protein
MKSIQSKYKLKVFNDGSSAYIWIHPWKGWICLSSIDYSIHSLWNSSLKNKNIQNTSSTNKIYKKKIDNFKKS